MRKPVKTPLGQLDLIADNIHFTGFLDDDNDFLSDISFYEYEGDDTEEELEGSDDFYSFKKRQDIFFPKDGKQLKLSTKNANRDRDGQKQAWEKIQKGGKSKIETSDEQSASDTDLKSDHDVSDELVRKHQKPSKKLRDGSANFVNFEDDMKVRRNVKPQELTSKRRGTTSLDIDCASGFRGEKVRDSKIKEEYGMEDLDVKESNAMNGKILVQSFQRRKKLCKAADLKPAGEKGHKGKNKGYVLEKRVKIGEKGSLIGAMQKNRAEYYGSDSEASPRKSFEQGLVKGQTLTEDDDELVRAELSGEGRNRPSVRKNLSSTGHAVKHWELKQEDVAGSSSTGKRQGPNQQLMPLVVRSKKNTGHAMKDLCVSSETVHSVIDPQKHAVEKVCDNGVAGEEVSSGVTEGAEGNKDLMPGENVDAEIAGTKVGWVMCDSCKKWRCIPAALIDMIESTNCGWFCKDNPNKKFADCSVPQEKTNTEINRELNLSEVSFCEELDEKNPAIDSTSMNGIEHQSKLFARTSQPQSTWTLIKHNIFEHRQRKTETLDEQMICTCMPPEGGGLGCGEDCHNRMLNIECVSQTCPCGDACSNQQFQRRLYKKVDLFRCGRKGFGLQVLEDIPKGAFIIEYVGEVLNVAAYEARQREYARRGQKHFYFMTLSGSEIIDACYKGNLGRFINHSCEPNCITEKWMVNGEVCIGLFAIRDLKKGEEITFDYNFVRACGAAAKKCLCGSRDCRGFIGGDPTTSQFEIHSDSDEDFPEPVMIEESSEEESRTEDSKTTTRRKQDEKIETIPPLELQSKHVKNKASFKASTSAMVKRSTIERDGAHFEGVEEELNKVIDENGGLRKGQPAVATSYLKLLVRTSASSAMAEGSRSTRDISLVLDALLKTQSRAILLEVSSMHGFRVLHKMLKQNKKDYKRTPIIRKLLKVLEFLAARRILTMEQINAEPTRSDMESVKDTIFELCRHADVEIQQMAHHFKDKYLKVNSQKPTRRGQVLSSDLSKWRLFPKQNQQGSSGAGTAQDDTTRKRKRPSRWDQPSQEVLDTTTAGGLPQSFWPFNANNLLLGTNQQSDASDHYVRQTEGASMDELGAMHPGPPSFSVPENQHHPEAAHIGPGVVSGIPVEQFSAGSSMGYMSQQGPICIGIPVSQFHGAGGPGSDFSYMPQMLTSTHQVAHPSDGQLLPFSSSMANVQEHLQHEIDDQSTDKGSEEADMNFGISHSQFFQQMHGIFGSAFHPWQLQSLMAPHAWGPFLAGDARIRDLGFVNESGAGFRQPNEYRGAEENLSKPGEPSGSVGYVQEVEPPVPGLSPPLPPPPSMSPFANPSLSMQTPKHASGRPFMGDDHLERSNMPHQQLKSGSWKPQRWNSPRWPKFQGNNRYRNPGFRRDFNHTQRSYRQNFGRQGPMRPHNWEDSSSRKHPDRNWGYPNARGMDHEESMDIGGDGGHTGPYGPPFQDSGNPSGSMPLEKPWGYGQQYPSGDPSNYYGNLSQEGVKDTLNSWGMNNQ